MRAARIVGAGFALLALVSEAGWPAEPSSRAGESIYLHGLLGSGMPLIGADRSRRDLAGAG